MIEAGIKLSSKQKTKNKQMKKAQDRMDALQNSTRESQLQHCPNYSTKQAGRVATVEPERWPHMSR